MHTANLDNVPLALDSTEVLDVVLELWDSLSGQEMETCLLPCSVPEPLHAQHQQAVPEEGMGGGEGEWQVAKEREQL